MTRTSAVTMARALQPNYTHVIMTQCYGISYAMGNHHEIEPTMKEPFTSLLILVGTNTPTVCYIKKHFLRSGTGRQQGASVELTHENTLYMQTNYQPHKST